MANNPISLYFHCRECVKSIPPGHSPSSWQSVEVGTDSDGFLIVWCRRHDMLVGRFELKSDHPHLCEKCGG